MDTTEKEIRNLFANKGELDRDEIALLLLQLVERIQNLENAKQRTWVGLTDEEIDYFIVHRLTIATKNNLAALIRICEAKIKEKNT